jgi:hypothetical protein
MKELIARSIWRIFLFEVHEVSEDAQVEKKIKRLFISTYKKQNILVLML